MEKTARSRIQSMIRSEGGDESYVGSFFCTLTALQSFLKLAGGVRDPCPDILLGGWRTYKWLPWWKKNQSKVHIVNLNFKSSRSTIDAKCLNNYRSDVVPLTVSTDCVIFTYLILSWRMVIHKSWLEKGGKYPYRHILQAPNFVKSQWVSYECLTILRVQFKVITPFYSQFINFSNREAKVGPTSEEMWTLKKLKLYFGIRLVN